MSEQIGVSEDLDSEGCLSSIKISTTERNLIIASALVLSEFQLDFGDFLEIREVICGNGEGICYIGEGIWWVYLENSVSSGPFLNFEF